MYPQAPPTYLSGNYLTASLLLRRHVISDKPEVKIVVTYPEGLTREGDSLDLSCIAEGKPL